MEYIVFVLHLLSSPPVNGIPRPPQVYCAAGVFDTLDSCSAALDAMRAAPPADLGTVDGNARCVPVPTAISTECR